MPRVKKKDHEKLDDSNIKHVIELLNSEKPITKKEACSILNISYNTKRLQTILDGFVQKQEHTAKRKAQNKGKPASDAEKKEIAQGLLEGDNYSSIAKGLYRSPAFVKSVALRLGVPEKATGDEKYKTAFLPDQCITDSFSVGETAWSAVHHAPVEIREELSDPKYEERYGCKCYRIYVKQKGDFSDSFFPGVQTGGYNAFLPAYDLGSLRHLKDLNIRWDLV